VKHPILAQIECEEKAWLEARRAKNAQRRIGALRAEVDRVVEAARFRRRSDPLWPIDDLEQRLERLRNRLRAEGVDVPPLETLSA
jgi:hypothetical protein